MKKKLVIFTDLDGTLLDYSTYSFQDALPALQQVREKNIPLILCSSKTRREIEYYRAKLDNHHPFISENGGGIFIPDGYFGFAVQHPGVEVRAEKENLVIRLGARYAELRKAIEELKKEGFKMKGFGDMTRQEVASLTGLSIEEAAMAKERDFDEPFIFEGGQSETQKLVAAIKAKGLNCTQGIFFHLLGNSDKGRAVAMVNEFYQKEYGQLLTVAIGDSPNDIPMLERVNCPVVVQKPDRTYDRRIQVTGLRKVEGIGPAGWNRAVLSLVSEFV